MVNTMMKNTKMNTKYMNETKMNAGTERTTKNQDPIR